MIIRISKKPIARDVTEILAIIFLITFAVLTWKLLK